jgi:ABC-type sulfate transport system permease subunit
VTNDIYMIDCDLQVKVAMITTPVLVVFCITAAVSAFTLHDSQHRKLLVGSIGLGVSVALYGSPLVAMVSHCYFLFLNHNDQNRGTCL